MDDDQTAVTRRLAAIDGRIRDFRERLEHHGLYDENHRMTEADLLERKRRIEAEVANRSVAHDEAENATDWLERELERWVIATDYDFGSGERRDISR